MRYLGGKSRQASDVLKVVNTYRAGRTRYLEPFIGGGSVFAKVSSVFDVAVGADVVPDLIALWTAMSEGWTPPTSVPREEWESLKSGSPSARRAWAGYAASYNGKWFAGYGPTASGRDYLAESQRSIMKKSAAMHPNATFVCTDYSNHLVNADWVVYCDPPYADTESYSASGGSFDHKRFWNCAERWVRNGAIVLVHEYAAPSGWVPVHSRDRVETMHHGGKSSGARTETIFCHVSSIAEGVAA